MNPLVSCCQPRILTGPSGRHLSHSRYCPVTPGLRITRGDAREIEHQERMAQVFLRSKPTPEENDGPHTLGRMSTWHAHKPGCPCEVCVYVDANLDARDDD